MKHTCHAHGCTVEVPPKMLMCRAHWFSLPKVLRDAIWAEYRVGQERDKEPSLRYMAVQRLAVARAAFRKNDEQAATVVAKYLQEAISWQQMAIGAGAGDPLAGLLPVAQ